MILKKAHIFVLLSASSRVIIFTPVLALLLYGCASTSVHSEQTHSSEREQSTFLNWQLAKCQLFNKEENITLRTDGHESHQTLRLTLHLPQTTQKPPLVSVLGIPTRDLNFSGAKKNWSFELPATPYTTARMLSGKAYIVVEYTPKPTHRTPTPQHKNAVFSLQELPEALLALYKRCENSDA